MIALVQLLDGDDFNAAVASLACQALPCASLSCHQHCAVGGDRVRDQDVYEHEQHRKAPGSGRAGSR